MKSSGFAIDPRLRAAAGGLWEWSLRLLLASVLLYAGTVKAGDAEGFALALAPFTFLPEPLLPVIAVALPWVEIALGIGLLLPGARPAALAAAGLFTVFILVIGWAVSEDIIVSCGCFGEEDEPPSPQSMWMVIVRNALLVAAALWVALRPPRRARSSQQAHRVP